ELRAQATDIGHQGFVEGVGAEEGAGELVDGHAKFGGDFLQVAIAIHRAELGAAAVVAVEDAHFQRLTADAEFESQALALAVVGGAHQHAAKVPNDCLYVHNVQIVARPLKKKTPASVAGVFFASGSL